MKRTAGGFGLALCLFAGLTVASGSQAFAQSADASAIFLPFSPPLDRPITVHIHQQQWGEDGKPRSFHIKQVLRFEQTATGFAVNAEIGGMTADAERDEIGRATKALGEGEVTRRRFLLDRAGRVNGLDDIDRIWDRFRNEQLTAAVGNRQNDPTAQALFAHFDGMSPVERLALLAGDIAPIIGAAARAVTPGPGSDEDLLCEVRNEADAQTRTDITACYARGTGILARLERRVVLIGNERAPMIDLWLVE